MNKKIFDQFLKLVSKVTNKRFVYVAERKEGLFAAVKSNYGFWYCGDISDQSDIAYGVASKGTVEAYDTAVVMAILKDLDPHFVLYDIGSNTGWYTMISFAASDTSTVYSFEPLLEHITYQKETIHLNRRDSQVTVFEIALSDHAGEETIRLGGSGTSLDKDFLEVDFGTRSVSVSTLDALVEEKKCALPDFVKIDVEGYEYKVLQGGMKTLEASKPVLFIEIAKTLNKGHFVHKEYELIFSSLQALDYTPYLVKDGEITPFDSSLELDGAFMFLFLNKKKHSALLEKINNNLLVHI